MGPHHTGREVSVPVENPAVAGGCVRVGPVDQQLVRGDGQAHDAPRVVLGCPGGGERYRRAARCRDDGTGYRRTWTGPAAVDHAAVHLHETNPDNGLVRDKRSGRPCSIAAVGMASHLPVVVERGLVAGRSRPRCPARLRSCTSSPRSPAGRLGLQSFFYHFLDIESGRRVWQCELSTIDSAFCRRDADAAAYFDHDTAEEAEVRRLADALLRRAD